MKNTNNDGDDQISSVTRNFPSYRKNKTITVQSWLDGKRLDDEAEGLWRIHDGIYDLSTFIDKHPGGDFWLKETKGTDITESFESHHISTLPEKMLQKFKVRDAAKPRNVTLTLNKDGFYLTLKRRIQNEMSSIDFKPTKISDHIHTSLLIATFVLSFVSAFLDSKLVAAIAGLCLCWTVIVGHNYFHRRNNWRMYTFNLSLMNFNEWRISHAISHHLYPNSYNDLEISLFEPIFVWLPNPKLKNAFQRYGSWLYIPIIYFLYFKLSIIRRFIISLMQKTNLFYWDDLIGFAIPLLLSIGSPLSLWMSIKLWFIIIGAASFSFALIGLNAAHHAPDIHHDGDADRTDRDWGLFQIDTIIDRSDLKGSQFLVLTHFGDHILHHLFPTLDHGILPQLYPIVYKTIAEFNCEIRECTHLRHIIEQHKQLARITPNPIAPGQKLK